MIGPMERGRSMDTIWIVCIAVAVLLLLLLAVCFVCYYMAFYSPTRKPLGEEEYRYPQGKIYAPYMEKMKVWMQEARKMPHQQVSVKSHDGLTLRGKLYEYAPGAIVELMFHGYRSDSERDMCGGVQRCFRLGRSALIVDQRGCGASDGHTISFGIQERKDCLKWVEFLIQKYGKDVRIVLTGISMGASTVMMAGGMELPENVVGIIADCGYSTPKKIIQKVMKQIHVPAKLMYPFVKLGARIYGGFPLEETDCLQAMSRCKVPVFFAHGEADAFVPYEMSVENYEACRAPKKLLNIPEAGHGLCYMLAPDTYCEALLEMEQYYRK